MNKLTPLFKSLARYDRVCVRCKERKPVKGGKILGRHKGAERFICGDCRAQREGTV